MAGIGLSQWTLGEQISDSLKVIKATRFKGFYLPLFMLVIMGGINIAFSFYSNLQGLGIVISIFTLFFSYVVVAESNASYYLKDKKKYNIKMLFKHFARGEMHITSSFFKALFCGILTGFFIALVILGFYYLADHDLFNNLSNYIDAINANSEFIDSFYAEVYPAIYIVNASILLMFFYWLFYFHRSKENSFNFSGSQVNSDDRFFVMPAISPRLYEAFSYNFKVRYRIKSSWTAVIDFVILGGGIAAGTYIGHLFGFDLPYFSPTYFGIGFALILFGFWYSFERAWDVAFFYHYKQEIYVSLTKEALNSMDEMKKAMTMLFPNGRLDLSEEFRHLNGIPENLITAEAISFLLLLQYKYDDYEHEDVAVNEIDEVKNENDNNDENDDDSGNLGVFGLGD
ncbi:MAG TPA: hypothetical protein DCY93_03275 [Firmicutes bacterium]|nr:hypothetical protein [Bacillota bacterium]